MDDAAALSSATAWSLTFVAVLCRVGMVVALLPGLGEAEAPTMVKAGLALVITILLLPVVGGSVQTALQNVEPSGFLIQELAVGALLGWLARLPALALSMGGAITSYMIGLTSVIQPDPALGAQSAVLARGMGLLAPVLILGTGLYILPLQALTGSYEVFPVGGVFSAGPTLQAVVAATSDAFGLALRIAGPFILVSVLLQAGLALLARLVPSLQVFSASAPGQILGGAILLAMLASPILAVWLDQLRSAWLTLPGS